MAHPGALLVRLRTRSGYSLPNNYTGAYAGIAS